MVIQIAFVICSFSILSYYESQDTHLGNSINIAGKNRYLTSNLLLQISEYFSQRGNSSSDLSEINSAMNQLESNILTLKQGGMISGVDLRPLPSIFLKDWNAVYQQWVSLNGILTNGVIQLNENFNSPAAAIPSPSVQAEAETWELAMTNRQNEFDGPFGPVSRRSAIGSMLAGAAMLAPGALSASEAAALGQRPSAPRNSRMAFR